MGLWQIEERRRQLTLAALGTSLFATTLPVNNERALFSPMGDVPILGDLSPVAYAITFGDLTPRGSDNPIRPVAFAARPPVEPFGEPPVFAAAAIPPELATPTPATPPLSGASPPSTGPGVGTPPGPPGSPSPPSAAPSPTPAVPEPATWLTMLFGFGIIGGIMRHARRRALRDAEGRPVLQ